MNAAIIELDCVYGENEQDDEKLRSFLTANKIVMRVLQESGPAGGWPVILFAGTVESIEKMLEEFFAEDEEELEFLKEEITILGKIG